MAIEITNLQKRLRVPEKRIRAALRRVMLEEFRSEVDVSLVVTTDAKIAAINRKFLSHAGPTDVIAFPLAGRSWKRGDGVFGEIVVSADRARAEAAKRRLPAEGELLLYAVHGMLHLAGYDDLTPTKRRRMRRRESEILKSRDSTAQRGKGK